MKPYDYYARALNFTCYNPNVLSSDAAARIKEINEKALTAADRVAAVAEIIDNNRVTINKANEPYYAELKRLRAEFWADMREELGYSKLLSETTVKSLENIADDYAHCDGSNEFEGIYDTMKQIAEIVAMITADIVGSMTPASIAKDSTQH